MSNVKLECEVCGKEFERRAAEVKRNKKLGRRVYCSRQCVGRDNNSHLDFKKGLRSPNFKRVVDEHSPFRFFMKCMKNRGGHTERRSCKITLQDLKEQWEKQEGKCPYTGWELKIAKSTNEVLPTTPDRASLDRIDSSRVYTKDNIQFVSLMAQYAKNGWTGEEVINFCRAVVENQG
jgi:hypothetical protein